MPLCRCRGIPLHHSQDDSKDATYALVMTTVFKFTKRQYAQAAVEEGRFRFSHAAEFRVSDGIADGRSDPKELTASADIFNGEETVSSNDPRFGGMFEFVMNGVDVPNQMVFTGGSLEVFDSGLLFCTALENSDDLFSRMQATFGAEAAYAISDVEEFARRIQVHLADTESHLAEIKARIQQHLDFPTQTEGFAEAIGRQLRRELEQKRPISVISRPVAYYDQPRAGSVAMMSSVDPFRKPTSYEWQREHRIVIRPYEVPGHLDIELPSLRDLLRIVR